MTTYDKIWELAKPYYEKGRIFDIPHIEWMQKESNKIADIESLDKKLLLPIVILHDVGYSKVKEKNPHIKGKDIKVFHMREGSYIAKDILKKVNYDKEKSKQIVNYIAVHDNWLLGDNTPFKECKEMAVFNDLDFLWVSTSIDTFKAAADSMGMNPKFFYDFWSKDEKLTNRPFCCPYTQHMWDSSMKLIKGRLDTP